MAFREIRIVPKLSCRMRLLAEANLLNGLKSHQEFSKYFPNKKTSSPETSSGSLAGSKPVSATQNLTALIKQIS